MYFVIPKLLLKGKYLLTAATVIVLFIITGAISAVISIYVIEKMRNFILPAKLNIELHRPFASAFFLSLLAGLRGGITIGGMAASIKLMKYWYIKEQRNLQLQKENTESQLQLLKAQVHPHFLFNTLNNIYSYTQNTSPVASELVMSLSNMLRCILYECNQPLIPVYKEIEMLKNYIMLEKIRYGNRLDISMDVPEVNGELHIAPLLLLPFVENSFKHGTSQVIEQPWLSIYIHIKNNSMQMRLLNGKAGNRFAAFDGCGIGIENVRRRLELLYKGRYLLDIKSGEEVFIVDLKLELERKTLISKTILKPEKVIIHE
jgi:LytS/YehU family sensor histidine kinase